MYFTETRGFLLLEEKQNYFNLKKNSFEEEEWSLLLSNLFKILNEKNNFQLIKINENGTYIIKHLKIREIGKDLKKNPVMFYQFLIDLIEKGDCAKIIFYYENK